MIRSPTTRQLAVLAGVSRTTVSLALRNHPSIPPATRGRIQQLAQIHGYRSDPLLATLMTRLRSTRMNRSVEKLAYLTSWNTALEWQKFSNERNWYEGACRRASVLGYDVEHFWSREPGMKQIRLSKILFTRGIRGVIIAPLLRPRGHLSLDWQHLAVAAISLTLYKPDVHRVSHSHHSGIIMALRSLKHRGYKRIGLANLINQDERVGHGWLAAYLLNSYYIPPRQQIPPLMVADWKIQEFKEWLEKYSPEVVISNTDEPYRLLQQLGYRVPEDIGYANLDVNENNPFSGIDQMHQEIGAGAVDLVARQLQSSDFGLPNRAQTVNIDGVWRDGATTLKFKSGAVPVPSKASSRRVEAKSKPQAIAKTSPAKSKPKKVKS